MMAARAARAARWAGLSTTRRVAPLAPAVLGTAAALGEEAPGAGALRAAGALAALALVGGVSGCAACEAEDEDELVVTNWSGTHSCRPTAVFAPESRAEVEAIVAQHHASKTSLRPCGSTLSPNGIALAEGGAMLNMALCDAVLEVDAERRTVRVECGARVDQVLEALAPHGLTLENLASIAQQQIGGFVQIGAHGTGASLPPVDEQVLSYTLVTPAEGTVTLSREDADGGELFRTCRVGLGGVGVLVEATLRCVPQHLLRERVEVLSRAEAQRRHATVLRDNRHARFMWIPHVDAVVLVTNNPTHSGPLGEGQGAAPVLAMAERLAPLRDLLYARCSELGVAVASGEVDAMHFGELRDALLALAPLDLAHVVRVNTAEAEFWRRSQGTSVADSSLKLNFECGGQQWVNECCFPCGSLDSPDGADLRYMRDVLAIIESEGIPAHAPIEQRWSSASQSVLSPANGAPGSMHSWVGVIMYLPTEDPAVRASITAAFEAYKRRCEALLWPRYGAVEHWAKIEQPQDADALAVRARLERKFDTAAFAAARRKFDPNGILGNRLLDTVLPC